MSMVILVVACQRPEPDPTAATSRVAWESTIPDSLPGVSYVEPAIIVSPRDPTAAVVATMRVDTDGRWTVSAFRSADGGRTWQGSSLPPIEGAYVVADPWLHWSSSGDLHLALLAHLRTADGVDRALVHTYRSSAGARSWSVPIRMPYGSPGSFDRPVIDGYMGSDGRERLALFATPPSVSRLRDDAGGWGQSELVVGDGRNNIIGAGALAQDGAAIVTWMTLEDSPESPLFAARAPESGETIVSVLDSAAVWRGPSIIAVDRGRESPYRGRLYIVWTSNTLGDRDTPEVLWARSGDDGRSWSPPDVLSTPTLRRYRAVPFVAVASTGVLGAAWYEAPGEGPCGRPVFRASLDGGDSWGPAIAATEAVHCPGEGREPAAGRWPWGSDYGAVAATSDGAFLVAWSDARAGVHRIRVTRIEVAR